MTLIGFLGKIYSSSLSKKIGVYKNQHVTQIVEIIKKGYYKYSSKRIRHVYSSNKLNNDNIPDFAYRELYSILKYDRILFKKLADYIYDKNVETINEVSKTRKIRVGFYLYAASLWSCSKIYNLFEKDSRFEPTVIVCRFNNGTPVTTIDEYNNTLEYFKSRGYRTIGVSHDGEVDSWANIDTPDILFLLTPYSGAIPKGFDILQLPLSCLNICIPYGINAIGVDELLNSPGTQLCWKYMAESNMTKQIKERHGELGAYNVVVSGHPKMDILLRPDVEYNPKDVWKYHEDTNSENVKRIIYAPHHSIFDVTIKFSTFHQNYKEILTIAKNNPLTTSWIVKPHQNLRKEAVLNGLFKSEEEYDEYLDMWDALPNAKTRRAGTYDDIFLTSDAMITDCGSFLTEYTSINKPLIFLRRPEQTFNEQGEFILPALYSVDGTDIISIENAINNVVLRDEDILQKERSKIIEEINSIYSNIDNATTSSEYIYHNIIQSLGLQDEK